MRYAAEAVIICLIISVLFYDNILFAFLLFPYCSIHIKNKRKKLIEKRKWRLNIEFCDSVNSLSASLEAGYSIENAITETIRDLLLIYSEEDMIISELRHIQRKLENNITLETAFEELATRSGIEDIQSFADIFSIAKRTGGDIMAIIRFTAGVIHMRVETKREAETAVAAKKYEADILKYIPFGIIAYLRFFSPDMIGGLYGSIFGMTFMSVILIIYYVLIRLADRLMDIEL